MQWSTLWVTVWRSGCRLFHHMLRKPGPSSQLFVWFLHLFWTNTLGLPSSCPRPHPHQLPVAMLGQQQVMNLMKLSQMSQHSMRAWSKCGMRCPSNFPTKLLLQQLVTICFTGPGLTTEALWDMRRCTQSPGRDCRDSGANISSSNRP